MKIASIVSTLTLGASVVHAAQLAADFPGICTSVADCKVYGGNYACVSVDSSVAGLENLSMCVPGGDTVCSGQISGACPTFAAWPKAYRVVQPVCVLVPVLNCNKKFAVSAGSTTGADAGVGAASTTGSGTVECYVRNFTTATQYKVVEGIYQCVDYAKYLSSNFGYLQNLTDATTAACAYNATAKTLCSGQGTCTPKSSFAQEYQCKCNKGYDGTANCSTVTSNQCSSLGQCGTLGTCTVSAGAATGACSCKAGSTGNQCTKCDATSTSACNSHGTCDATGGVCTCAAKYSGPFCTDSTTGTTTTTPKPSSESARLGAFVATAIATGTVVAAAVGAMTFAS